MSYSLTEDHRGPTVAFRANYSVASVSTKTSTRHNHDVTAGSGLQVVTTPPSQCGSVVCSDHMIYVGEHTVAAGVIVEVIVLGARLRQLHPAVI